MNIYCATINQRKRARQFALNRSVTFLNLPAVKVCAIVLKE
jgi:hypothetical protein